MSGRVGYMKGIRVISCKIEGIAHFYQVCYTKSRKYILQGKKGKVMNVRDFIIEETIKDIEKRIERLREINAPAYLLSIEREELYPLYDRKIKIIGETSLLEVGYMHHEIREERGKVCVLINGDIKYYPKGKKGRVIISC